jgi:hypothetical protein
VSKRRDDEESWRVVARACSRDAERRRRAAERARRLVGN